MDNKANKLDYPTNQRPLSRDFYTRYTLNVARDLLGKIFYRRKLQGLLVGRFVEVEAYRGVDDPASHAFRRLTPRNRVMFGKAGVTYVYFTYGNHHCLNIVTEEKGKPGAVLIRAMEPLFGIEVMKANRGVTNSLELTSGPGKLTKAFQITLEDNGCDLTQGGEMFITSSDTVDEFEIGESTRVGIRVATDKPWRYFIKGNLYVSRR